MDIKLEDIEKISMDDVTIEINRLYKKSKEEGLNEEEKKIQEALRKRYIDAVKGNLRAQLNGAGYKK